MKIQTGAFSLKADSLKLDEVKLNDTNVVFNKWKETSNEDSKASSQITAAATTPKTNEPKSQSKVSNEEENKKAPLQQQQQQQQPKQLQNQPTTSAVASSSSSKASSTITSPTKATEANNTKPVKRWQILQGVVFALSGFQNPERSDIRDKGLKMGAKYRPDWTDDCTHLVSAFGNCISLHLYMHTHRDFEYLAATNLPLIFSLFSKKFLVFEFFNTFYEKKVQLNNLKRE